MELKRLKIDDIQIPEVRVTARFTEEAWEQFRSSYKQTGQIDPILIYEVEGKLWLCDGLHRLVEAKNQGETEILAVVIPGDLADVFTKNILVDHLRGKTPASEMTQVIKFLWKELDLDSDGIAEKTGLTRDYVEKLQKISELTPWCLEQLDQEKIGIGVASALTRLKDPVMQETLCNQALMYRWTVKEVEDQAKEIERIVAEQPEPAPEEGERPPVLIQCQFCRQKFPLGQIANPNTCSGCAGILYATIAEAERQFREEQTARQDGVGG